MTTRDWRASHEQTRRRLISELEARRDRGETWYRFGQRGDVVDPSRLSHDAIQKLARREADRATDRAINRHNEQASRAA